jgi:cyanuric acid amidohydrolase
MERRQIDVFRVPMRGPADISGLVALIENGNLDPATIVAILGKTEGNGGVNDFTREYATAALCAGLSPILGLAPVAVDDRIAIVMSGGTEGVLSPYDDIRTAACRRQTGPCWTKAAQPRHRHDAPLSARGNRPRRPGQ